jgi:hypothetical protein
MRNSSLERRQSAVSHFVDPGAALRPLQARPLDPSRFTRTSTPTANRASTPAPAAVTWTPPPTLNRYANGGSAGRTPISGYQPANAPGSCPWTWTPTTGEPGGPRGSTQRAAPGDDHIPNRTRRYAACLPIPCRRSPDTHQRRSTRAGLGCARGGRLCRCSAQSHGGAVRVAGAPPLSLRYRGTLRATRQHRSIFRVGSVHSRRYLGSPDRSCSSGTFLSIAILLPARTRAAYRNGNLKIPE